MKNQKHINFAKIILILSIFIINLKLYANDHKLSFNRDIRPILSENCYLCHGYDKNKRKGKLRLDTFEGATKIKNGEAAIVPNQPDKSLLIQRIESQDKDELMPPPDSAYKLTSSQKKLLKQWILEGAEYEDHWAFMPLSTKPYKTIDAGLEEQRKKQQLKIGPKADPRTLLRRLSYDLKGVPPSAKQVAQFQKNPSQLHYENIVDQYFASIEHAEHQALKWLDLVRWANTSGMVSDEPIDSEAYRNYVIQSFHQNKPFDRFTIEQLAGDLLKNPDNTSLVASGYNRIVKTNCEAGVIEEEALYDLKGEHVRALGTVWMGLTTGCAQCHDHKYDPISQQDYYNLAAFFDDLVEVGCYSPGDRRIPLHHIHSKDAQQKLDAQLTAEIGAKYRDLYQFKSINQADYTAWQKEKVKVLKGSGNFTDFVWFSAKYPYSHVMSGEYQLTQKENREARRTKAQSGKIQQHEVAESITGFLAKDTAQNKKNKGMYVSLYLNSKAMPKWIAVQSLHGAYGRMGWKDTERVTFVWGKTENDAKLNKDIFKSAYITYMGPLPKSDQWVRLNIPGNKIKKSSIWPYTGMSWIQEGGEVYWGESGFRLQDNKSEEFKMGNTSMRMFLQRPYHRMDYDKRFNWPALIVKKPAKERSKTEEELLKRCYFEDTNPDKMEVIEDLEYRLSVLRKEAQKVLVSQSGPRKMTRVLPRGDFMDKSGPEAFPAIPAYFGRIKTISKRATRLDLAKWLVDENNPLTARVIVNRLWAQFFGKGFSSTLEDIGSQGDWPSHPELLDQLAQELIQSGWDLRSIMKKIVISEAYQLSSMPNYSQLRIDSENYYLSRQNRFRYHAEAIRDSALKVSGLLHKTVQYPKGSKFFHQPKAYWELSSKIMYGSRHMLWDTSQNESQHYRSIYGFYKRQNAHPTLLAFDGPTRQECTTHRMVTNTPAQALTLLNDPIFLDAAKGLGQQINSLKGDLNEKINQLFLLSLQRLPAASESKVIEQLYRKQLKQYKTQAKLRKTFISNIKNDRPSELAAWIIVSRVMLNLHESITRL